MHTEANWFNTHIFEILAIILVAGGFLAVYYFSFVDDESLNNIGDFFGGVAGSLWALASVILFYAALRHQTNEMSRIAKFHDENMLRDNFFRVFEAYNNLINANVSPERKTRGKEVMETKEWKGKASISSIRHYFENKYFYLLRTSASFVDPAIHIDYADYSYFLAPYLGHIKTIF